MRVWGVPLHMRSSIGLLIALAVWRGYGAVHDYVFVGETPVPASLQMPADFNHRSLEEQRRLMRAMSEGIQQFAASLGSAPVSHPSALWGLAAVVGMALVLVGSILLHELGHLAAVRRFGLEPIEIELSGFGGTVAFHRAERLRAGSLAAIAAAGPLVTAALVVASYAALGGSLGEADADGSAALVVHELLRACFFFNLVVLVFNLLPLRGLDGRHLIEAAQLRLARG
jgi:Zn-dependent protease